MAKFEVTAVGARGNGIAFERGDHMLDRGWEASFDTLTEALNFIRTRKSGWAFTDDSTWARRAVKELYLHEYFDGGKHRCTWLFDVTGPREPNVEVSCNGHTYNKI